MSRQAQQTAIGPMVIAAVEQTFPPGQRVLDDPFARELLPFGGRFAASVLRVPGMRGMMIAGMERDYPGLWSWMLCRKRFIDDNIAGCAAEVSAVVNLGAGFDTRALRLSALRDMPVWEVDQPDNIAAKRARLQELGDRAPRGLTLVPIDFERQELPAELVRHNYSLEQKTFFIWEGVTQYLAEPGIRSTLAFLSRSTSGSALSFTYVDQAMLTGATWPGAELLHRRFVTTGIWRFGMTPSAVPDLLGQHGWRLVEDVEPADLAARYVAQTGRKLKVAPPLERAVFARKV